MSTSKTRNFHPVDLEALADKHVGPRGTPRRDNHEDRLAAELLAIQLRNLREEEGLTQEELGQRIDMSKQAVNRLEKRPADIRLNTLLRVAAGLGYDVRIEFRSRKGSKPRGMTA